MKVLCVAQQKGGVCKTTTVLSLASAWAGMGRKVLTVDLDPQANLTRNIVDYEKIGKDVSMMYGSRTDALDCVMPTGVPNLDLIPAKTALNRVENLERTLATYNTLKRELPKFSGTHDLVILDTPPSLGLFTVSALLAATHVLVPVQPTFFCQEGLGDLNQTILEAREGNPNLGSVRYFITLYDRRTVISQELLGIYRDKLKDRLFDTMIRRNISIEESQYAQRTIFDYAPKSTGATDYFKLAKEVLVWLESS